MGSFFKGMALALKLAFKAIIMLPTAIAYSVLAGTFALGLSIWAASEGVFKKRKGAKAVNESDPAIAGAANLLWGSISSVWTFTFQEVNDATTWVGNRDLEAKSSGRESDIAGRSAEVKPDSVARDDFKNFKESFQAIYGKKDAYLFPGLEGVMKNIKSGIPLDSDKQKLLQQMISRGYNDIKDIKGEGVAQERLDDVRRAFEKISGHLHPDLLPDLPKYQIPKEDIPEYDPRSNVPYDPIGSVASDGTSKGNIATPTSDEVDDGLGDEVAIVKDNVIAEVGDVISKVSKPASVPVVDEGVDVEVTDKGLDSGNEPKGPAKPTSASSLSKELKNSKGKEA